MIITRTPFRISFAGGGSDLQSYYRKFGGCVVSTSIDKYIYLSAHPYFNESQTLLKYSKTELVQNIDEVQHPIFKSVLKEKNVSGVEIVSTADIPSGTGLGSSSAFTVGLFHTLSAYQGKYCSKAALAAAACRTEIDRLGAPIGKQDQYAAAFGGLNYIRFNKDDTVAVEPIIMRKEVCERLQQNLVMFYTGNVRSASRILQEQRNNMNNADKVENLHQMCDLADSMRETLQDNDISTFGAILHKGWMLKQELASEITNAEVNKYYETAMNHGALGGKLLGAGGGGFLLFYCELERQAQLRAALKLKELKFHFDPNGTSVIYVGDKYWE